MNARINGYGNFRVVPALPEHAFASAFPLRAADAREVWAAGGHTPEEAVRESLRRSLHPGGRAWAVLLNTRPVMFFGVAPAALLSDVGAPWMLASEEWDEVLATGLNLAFARRCRAFVSDMGRGFARLENHVHADNDRAIRWLEWLGFRFDPPAPFGVYGEMFLRFWKECAISPTGCGGPRSAAQDVRPSVMEKECGGPRSGSELGTCAASDSPSRTGRAAERHGEGVRGSVNPQR